MSSLLRSLGTPRRVGGLLLLMLLCVLARPACAWPPVTHAYLAELAIQEAISTGKVTIYAVDYANGQIRRDAQGNKIVVGQYNVSPDTLRAIRGYRNHYITGVTGPDAYPDIMTGQELIHPAGRNTPGQRPDTDINDGGPGSGKWLQHLYDCAFGNESGVPFANDAARDSARAFVLGFFAHAAGDLYAHTYVNYYTGSAFHLPQNGLRHILTEHYLKSRTPKFLVDSDYDVTLSNGLDTFIYNNMVRNDMTWYLQSKGYLTGTKFNKSLSIPYVYSHLRDVLKRKINDYNQMSTAEKVLYALPNEYRVAWVNDIDAGLKAWPEVSRRLSVAIFFNRDGKIQKDVIVQVLNDYLNDHLLAMSGFPKFVGKVAATAEVIKDKIEQWQDEVLDALGITEIKTLIKQFKTYVAKQVADFILQAAFGVTLDQLETYFRDPATQMNAIYANGDPDGGVRLTTTELDRQMHLKADGTFDYEQFAPAYNTVTMIKLSLLGSDELTRLWKDLNGGTAPTQAITLNNILLGYIETLDGSNQWRANGVKMLYAQNGVFYRDIFMRQMGEMPYPNVVSLTLTTNQASGKPTFSGAYQIAANTETTGTEIGFTAYAQSGGTTTAALALPIFQHLDQNQTSGTFSGILPSVDKDTTFLVTATDGSAQTATLLVHPASLVDLYTTSTTKTTIGGAGGGAPSISTSVTDFRVVVGLDAAAPADCRVYLTSDHPEIAQVPAYIVIPAGSPSSDQIRPQFAAGTKAGDSFTLTAKYTTKDGRTITKSVVVTFQTPSLVASQGIHVLPQHYLNIGPLVQQNQMVQSQLGGDTFRSKITSSMMRNQGR